MLDLKLGRYCEESYILNVANNGRLQNYFNHIQSPPKLLCQYELCSQKKKIISEQKLSNLLRNITNSFISYYPDQCVVKTTSHQSITTVASVTRVQHLNCHKHRTKACCPLKASEHTRGTREENRDKKRNQITNGVRGLQEKESLLQRLKFKKKKGGGRSSIMQEVGQHKFGGEGNAILFLLLNCNICIAWMRKSTEAEKRTWKRTAGKCSVETLSTGTKHWEILLQTAKIYLTPLLGERYEGNEWDWRIKTQNWCQRINSSKHLKERQTLTWQLPDKNDTLKKKKNPSRHDIPQSADSLVPDLKLHLTSTAELERASYPHKAGDSKSGSGTSISDILNPWHHCSVKCYQPDLLRGRNVKKN